jgi:hypothetical protein
MDDFDNFKEHSSIGQSKIVSRKCAGGRDARRHIYD